MEDGRIGEMGFTSLADVEAAYIAERDAAATIRGTARLNSMLEVASSAPQTTVAPATALRRDGGWTRDLILTRLDRVYRAAFLDRKWPSAIRALELAGYEFGMFTKRVELDAYSDDHLRRIAEKAGLTLDQLRDAQAFLEAEVLND